MSRSGGWGSRVRKHRERVQEKNRKKKRKRLLEEREGIEKMGENEMGQALGGEWLLWEKEHSLHIFHTFLCTINE